MGAHTCLHHLTNITVHGSEQQPIQASPPQGSTEANISLPPAKQQLTEESGQQLQESGAEEQGQGGNLLPVDDAPEEHAREEARGAAVAHSAATPPSTVSINDLAKQNTHIEKMIKSLCQSFEKKG